MKRWRTTAVVLGSVVAVTVGLSSVPFAQEMPIKQVMAENFAAMNNILVGLITSSYAAIPDQVGIVHAHAIELTQAVPDSVKGDRDRFLGYAYNLQGHSADLKSIVEELIVHDAATEAEGRLVPDHLRAAAAAHYASMVTMCVSCHNHYRLTPVNR